MPVEIEPLKEKAVSDSLPPRRVAYLINTYPKVSHTFIRREIRALEGLGVCVDRFALRGWDDRSLVDCDDIVEREKTSYVLRGGLGALFPEVFRTAATRPKLFIAALLAALAMSVRSVRPLPYHLVWLAHACRIRRWIEMNGSTHLHAHFGTNPAEIARLVRLLGGPPYSFTIHGQDEIENATRLHFGEKVKDSAFAVAISAFCRSQILREIPRRDWKKLNVIHCGLDRSYFEDTVPAPPGPRFDFLTIGRLSPEKGHLILLDAFAMLAERHPWTQLVIAGDGPMFAEIEARVATLGLESVVRFTGWIDAIRIKAEIDAATALVQPSFIEGLPVVIMEAMARKRAVISTYVAGIPELVLPGETGWLVPAGDVEALFSAMEALLYAGKERLSAMGEAGHARVRERHSIDRETAKLAALFFGQGRD